MKTAPNFAAEIFGAVRSNFNPLYSTHVACFLTRKMIGSLHMNKVAYMVLGIMLLAIIVGGIFWLNKKPAEPAVQGIPDVLIVKAPLKNSVVTSPLRVTGSARGTFYFEASFPVRVLDANRQELAVTPAQAQSEWMTENFVPFVATLTFEKPSTNTGYMVFEKDNPSGLPEHDQKFELPIRFE